MPVPLTLHSVPQKSEVLAARVLSGNRGVLMHRSANDAAGCGEWVDASKECGGCLIATIHQKCGPAEIDRRHREWTQSRKDYYRNVVFYVFYIACEALVNNESERMQCDANRASRNLSERAGIPRRKHNYSFSAEGQACDTGLLSVTPPSTRSRPSIRTVGNTPGIAELASMAGTAWPSERRTA